MKSMVQPLTLRPLIKGGITIELEKPLRKQTVLSLILTHLQ